ncbi:LacI family DNA-binding transcriptional regulator [Caldilinea sp.]|uniref:LacI family DNA-binding transcriptional regulator n=1 Tax=Caldilinea sp. TaxID=2293560 RepID=UPI002BC88B9D|nr:LacI family DNA-binding transcriptional regulator [Anaerolineales bacterium]HQY94115.1 LacI family DNA-binding transcriptional regulator [Caldilinea sp.]HRA68427.1 LacI family DNA-binding transcriptional regulator [Caldilinea sp.]
MSKRPSLHDIAVSTGVSVSTVSLVLNDRPGISTQTRSRVLEAAAKLGYELTPSVQNQQTSNTIGLLIEQGSMHALLDIFYGDIIRGFQTEAQRLGYQVLLHMYDRHNEGLDAIQSNLAERVQGLIIANDGDITPEMVVQLEDANIPLVLIENHVEGHRLPSILGDNFTAGYTVMRHLLALGHRDIAILRGPGKYSSLVDRLHGCLAAAAESALTIPEQFLPPPVVEHPQKGYMQMKRILALPQKPTAVVAISDKTAFGAMSAICETGLSIPDDIAIVSIDNVADSLYTHPPLTTYHIPKRDMGVLAMQRLHRIIQGEAEIAVKSVVYGELIVRESCGALH